MSTYHGLLIERVPGEPATELLSRVLRTPLLMHDHQKFELDSLDLEVVSESGTLEVTVHERFIHIVGDNDEPDWEFDQLAAVQRMDGRLACGYLMNDTAMATHARLVEGNTVLAESSYEERSYGIKYDGVDWLHVAHRPEQVSVLDTIGKEFLRKIDVALGAPMQVHVWTVAPNEGEVAPTDPTAPVRTPEEMRAALLAFERNAALPPETFSEHLAMAWELGQRRSEAIIPPRVHNMPEAVENGEAIFDRTLFDRAQTASSPTAPATSAKPATPNAAKPAEQSGTSQPSVATDPKQAVVSFLHQQMQANVLSPIQQPDHYPEIAAELAAIRAQGFDIPALPRIVLTARQAATPDLAAAVQSLENDAAEGRISDREVYGNQLQTHLLKSELERRKKAMDEVAQKQAMRKVLEKDREKVSVWTVLRIIVLVIAGLRLLFRLLGG